MSIKIGGVDIEDIKAGDKNIDEVYFGNTLIGKRSTNTSYGIDENGQPHFFGMANTLPTDFVHNDMYAHLTINGEDVLPGRVTGVVFAPEMAPVMQALPDNFLRYMPSLTAVVYIRPSSGFFPIFIIGNNYLADNPLMTRVNLQYLMVLQDVGSGFASRCPQLQTIGLGPVDYMATWNARTSVIADLCKAAASSPYYTLEGQQFAINSFKNLFPTVSRRGYYRRYNN